MAEFASSGVPPPQWLEMPATRRTIAIYNAALDRFVAIHGSDLARGRTDIFWTPLGGMEVSTEFVARAPYRAGYFDTFILADHVSIRGMGKRVRASGLGVALVGSRERTPEREKEMFYQPAGRGVYVPFAAVAEFDPQPATDARIRLIDLNRASTITIAGGKVALDGDFTAPFALSFRGINDLMMGISGLINVEKREKDAGLYLAEPFDPDRIPVVMIHGLSSSLWFGERSPPVSWAIHRFAEITSFGTFTIRPECRFWSRPHRYAMRSPRFARHMIRAERRLPPVTWCSLVTAWEVLSRRSSQRAAAIACGMRLPKCPSIRWRLILRIAPNSRNFSSGSQFLDLIGPSSLPPASRHPVCRLRLAGIGGRLVRLPGDFLQFQMRMLNALGEILQGDFATMGVMTGITSLSPLLRSTRRSMELRSLLG